MNLALPKRLELVPIETLAPYEKNSRTHSVEQVAQIAASIKEFGFTNPILIDGSQGIIAGHGRLAAAKLLGMSQVPIVMLDHLTETQKRAYIIADNKLALNAGWDESILAAELVDLRALDFDIDVIGFSDEELAELLDPEVEQVAPGEANEVPDAVPEPKVVRGEVYVLGNHRLMCGDSTSITDVEQLLAGKKADMVFTDPPYNVNYGANGNENPAGWTQRTDRTIMNDKMSGDEFRDFCRSFISCIVASTDGCVYVFGPPGPDGRIMFTECDQAMHCSTTLVWKKDNFVLGRGKYHNKYEPCWFGWVGSGSRFVDDRTLTNVWEFDRPRKSELHPTMKPVELVEQALGHASKKGDLVLDLFGGSGTTMIASEKSGRSSCLMELDPKYAQVILERWEKYTGKKAHREDGKPWSEIRDAV